MIPKVDDCIALSLGSRAEHQRQVAKAPGTFYLTRGWIESGDDPYTEYLRAAERYGPEKAYRLEKRIIANYTRLALIDTGNGDMAQARIYAQHEADFFGMAFEEIQGSDISKRRLLGATGTPISSSWSRERRWSTLHSPPQGAHNAAITAAIAG